MLASPELRTAQGLDFRHVLTGTKLSSPPLYHSEVSVWGLGPEGERVEQGEMKKIKLVGMREACWRDEENVRALTVKKKANRKPKMSTFMITLPLPFLCRPTLPACLCVVDALKSERGMFLFKMLG